jgi:hypothetical protein
VLGAEKPPRSRRSLDYHTSLTYLAKTSATCYDGAIPPTYCICSEAGYLKAINRLLWYLIRRLPRDKTYAKGIHPTRYSMPRSPVAPTVKELQVLETNGYREFLRGFLVGAALPHHGTFAPLR